MACKEEVCAAASLAQHASCFNFTLTMRVFAYGSAFDELANPSSALRARCYGASQRMHFTFLEENHHPQSRSRRKQQLQRGGILRLIDSIGLLVEGGCFASCMTSHPLLVEIAGSRQPSLYHFPFWSSLLGPEVGAGPAHTALTQTSAPLPRLQRRRGGLELCDDVDSSKPL